MLQTAVDQYTTSILHLPSDTLYSHILRFWVTFLSPSSMRICTGLAQELNSNEMTISIYQSNPFDQHGEPR